MFSDITVLITAAGNVFMPGTTACIKNNGERSIRLIGADMNDDPSLLNMVDTYYKVPRGDDPRYVEVLLDICAKEKVDVLLPIMSVELECLAQNRKRFGDIGTSVSVSNIDSLRIANDKVKLFDFMTQNGLECAMYHTVNSIEELETAAFSLGYPNKLVCVKATHGSGSRGFRIIDETRSRFDMFLNEKPNASYIKMKELKEMLLEADEFPQLMLMEYLPGHEYTIDLLADNGKVLYNCCRRSLRMENSIMLDCVVEDNKEAQKICAEVTAKLSLDGNIGFDVREREDGIPVIMECNPRITAGIPVFAMAGVNLPYLCIKKLLGEKMPNLIIDCGKIVHRRWMEM